MTDREALQFYAANGNADAFATLVHRYQGMVYAACIRVLGQSSDLDDIVQETFLQLATHAKRIHTSPRAWLYQCAFNLAAKSRRSAEARNHREEAWAATAIPPELPIDTADWRELLRDVDACIAELQRSHRSAVIGYYLSGRTLRELADEEGVSVPGMKKRVDRALVLVRENLSRRGAAVTLVSLQAAFAEGMLSAQVPATVTTALMKIGVAGVGVGISGTPAGVSVGLKVAVFTVAVGAVVAVSAMLRPAEPPAIGRGGDMAATKPPRGHETVGRTSDNAPASKRPPASQLAGGSVYASAAATPPVHAEGRELGDRLRAMMALSREDRMLELRDVGAEYAASIDSKDALDRFLTVVGTLLAADGSRDPEFNALFAPIVDHWTSAERGQRFGNWMAELHNEKGKTIINPDGGSMSCPDDPYEKGLIAFGTAWIRRDAEVFTAWLLNLQEQEPSTRLIGRAAMDQWMDEKPKESAEFFGKVFAMRAEDRAKWPEDPSRVRYGDLASMAQSLTIKWLAGNIQLTAKNLDHWILAYPDEKQLPPLYDRVGKAWAQVDADAAYRWASSLEHDEARSFAFRGMIAGIAEQAPEKAAEWLESFPPGEMRNRSAYSVGLRWASTNRQAEAWQWADSLDDAAMRSSAMDAVARVTSQSDLLGTLDRIKESAITADERANLYEKFMRGMEVPPEQVSKALEMITIESLQKEIIYGGVRMLAINQSNYPGAAAWAVTLESPMQRQTAIEAAYRLWIRRDEVAANAWLDQTDASEAEKARLKKLTIEGYPNPSR